MNNPGAHAHARDIFTEWVGICVLPMRCTCIHPPSRYVPPRYMSNPLDVPGDVSTPAELLTWQICSSSFISVHFRGQYLGNRNIGACSSKCSPIPWLTTISGWILQGLMGITIRACTYSMQQIVAFQLCHYFQQRTAVGGSCYHC